MTLHSDKRSKYSLDDLRGVKFQAAYSKLKKRYSVERSVVDVEASKQENDLIKLKSYRTRSSKVWGQCIIG